MTKEASQALVACFLGSSSKKCQPLIKQKLAVQLCHACMTVLRDIRTAHLLARQNTIHAHVRTRSQRKFGLSEELVEEWYAANRELLADPANFLPESCFLSASPTPHSQQQCDQAISHAASNGIHPSNSDVPECNGFTPLACEQSGCTPKDGAPLKAPSDFPSDASIRRSGRKRKPKVYADEFEFNG